jgi:uncharacterized protein (DUF58 family)
MDSDYEQALRLLGKKHDAVAVVVEDDLEKEIPSVGLVEMLDAESGDVQTVDTSSPLFRKFYKQKYEERKKKRDQDLRKSAVSLVPVKTEEDFVDPLIAYFKARKKR